MAYLRSVDVNGRIHVAFGIKRTQPPCCINNKHFQTFESNRLMIMHSESYPKEWRYVNRDVNPADDGSKGLKLDALLKDDRWIRGPQFLGKDESSWPKMVEIPELKDEDPAVRKEAQNYSIVVNVNALEKVIGYHSSWWKLRRCVAWLLRYKQYIRGKNHSLPEDQ